MPTLLADGSSGVVCIYNGADDVVANPNADLSRVLFHSNLTYPKIIETRTASVTFEALTGPNYRLATKTLFAHGKSGIPFVLGYATNIANVNVPLSGSVPALMVGEYGRWITLGADATNVVLHEQTVANQNTATGTKTTIGQQTITCVIYVTDLILA